MPNDAVETARALVRRARKIDRELAMTYPDARCELDYSTPLELLVATVLSAQTTDVRVNKVTPELFETYPDAASLAAASLPDLEDILHPLGFQRAKARALTGLGLALVANHAGQVPKDREALMTLPGVGRKTANVVLGEVFGVPSFTVDTHVGRVSRRLGLTAKEDPLAVELELQALFESRQRTAVSHRLIFHGRRTCSARSPQCGICTVAQWCPTAGTFS